MSGSFSGTFGAGNTVTGDNSGAFGTGQTVNGDGSYAIGDPERHQRQQLFRVRR